MTPYPICDIRVTVLWLNIFLDQNVQFVICTAWPLTPKVLKLFRDKIMHYIHIVNWFIFSVFKCKKIKRKYQSVNDSSRWQLTSIMCGGY